MRSRCRNAHRPARSGQNEIRPGYGSAGTKYQREQLRAVHQMHRVHGLLPGRPGQSRLPRPQAGRSRRGAAAPEGGQLLRRGAEILPQLQALRGGMSLERAHRRHHPVGEDALREIAAESPRPDAGQHGLRRADGHDVRPDRQYDARMEARQGRNGRRAAHRPPPDLPQLCRADLRAVVPQARGGTAGGFRSPRELLPRLLHQL